MKIDGPNCFDVVIVGAGIVGLTVARELKMRAPKMRIAILEKEHEIGLHASGRNSGVLHSGIYYGSDTIKARVCADGSRRMIEFAKSEKIEFRQCGKIILATAESDLPTITKLVKNARENGVPAELVDPKTLQDIEPYAAQPVAAIFCSSTAVIDSRTTLERIREILIEQGVSIIFNCSVRGAKGDNSIDTNLGVINYGYLINCAGAYADPLAKKFGMADEYRLLPFKGIYWKLSKAANHKVRANIYPVPDVSMPFLGVHVTRVISGDVYVGPTAIPAFGRENYGIVQGMNLGESAGIGVQLFKMYMRNQYSFRKLVYSEMQKYRKKHFLAAAQKLVPSLEPTDMVPTSKSGIRPQLVNIRTKKLEMDYILCNTDNSLHVLNAISPAFTSSMAFAELIVNRTKIA